MTLSLRLVRQARAGLVRSPRPARNPARVLFVDHQVRDFLQYRSALPRGLREAGFEVHAALPREAGLDEVSRQGVRAHVVHMRRKSIQLFGELQSVISLLRLYRRLRPILVHHIGLKPTLYGSIAARLARVPAVVSTLTGLGYVFSTGDAKARMLRWLVIRGLRVGFRHQNCRVVFQHSCDRDHIRAGTRVSRGRALLIRSSGVDLSRFLPTPEAAGPPVVLMASRLLWNKGVGEFVTAAQILRARGCRARFLMIGDPDPGHPSAVPTQALEHWRDAGDIEWLGWQQEMPSLLANSHVVCLPSYYGEGIPRILLEAAASGRPIVATDTPGCREVVRHGENGLLVPPRNIEALADAILRFVDDPRLRTAMGARGRVIAETEFEQTRVTVATLAVYRRLLASLPGAGFAALTLIPCTWPT
jgi:glycosyltransferase involved in cell wall biosynthesis